MKTKSKKNLLNYPVPAEFDLFGETSVTISEVDLWMKNVPRMDRSSPRFDWYVKNWAVVEKIQAVKSHFFTLDAYFLKRAENVARY